MMLQYLRQKLRRLRCYLKKNKSGGIYHHHFHEIVVTKEELSIQLYSADNTTDEGLRLAGLME